MRHLDALLHVAVEPDALGDAKSRRLADIVQQRAQRQRRARIPQLFKQQQRVDPHVPFGVIFRWLRHSLHGRHLGQDVGKQSGLIQQLEAAARPAFRQNADQLVANPLRGDFENQVDAGAESRAKCRLQSDSSSRAAKRTARSSRK